MGLAEGTYSLISKTVGGAFGSVNKISGTISTGLNKITLVNSCNIMMYVINKN